MNNEEYQDPKQKVLKLMGNVVDKNSMAYQQVAEVLIRRDLVMDALNNMPNYYFTISEAKQLSDKDKQLPMEEVVKACLSFQQISDTQGSGKLVFDLLMEPIISRMSKLTKLEKMHVDYNREAPYLRQQLAFEIKKGCIDLQYGLDSFEVKTHALKKSIEILNLNKDYYQERLNIPNSLYESVEVSGYREIIIDSFFGIMGQNKGQNQEAFRLFFDCLKQDKYLPELLQRTDLSENEKKAYIHAAVKQSHLPLSGNAINYFREKDQTKSRSKVAKQIAEKEIVYLIAKEVNTDTAITFDEMLRGKREKTVAFMTRLYAEAPSTRVKESIRKQVEKSFDLDAKFAFYKESVRQRLTQEQRQAAELSSKAALHPHAATLAKLEQFEKIHTVFELPESKQQYDYPESKELLAGLRKCLFGDEVGRKIETILLLKQEAPKEKVDVPELLEKNIKEIQKLRIASGLHTINAKIFVAAKLPDAFDEKKVHIEELADTMFKLKANFSNWNARIQKQVKKQLMPHLKEKERNQVIKIFKEKEALHQLFAVDPELEKEWKKSISTTSLLNRTSKFDKLEQALEKLPIHEKIRKVKQAEKGKNAIFPELDKNEIRQFESTIDNILSEKSPSDKERIIRGLRKKLIDERVKIKDILKNVSIFVREHGDPATSIEKQFHEELYKDEMIQNFVKRDPKLKTSLYECQQLVPFTEKSIDIQNRQFLKENKRMNGLVAYVLCKKQGDVFSRLPMQSSSDKDQQISNLNYAMEELWEKDRKKCLKVIKMLLLDSTGHKMTLGGSYIQDFRSTKFGSQENRGLVEKIFEKYEHVKAYRPEQKHGEKWASTTLSAQKETTKPESAQSLAGKIQGTRAVPKTNPAVTSQPAAFETVKSRVVKEISGTSNLGLNSTGLVTFQALKDQEKEAAEINRQKKEKGSAVQGLRKVFEK